ncbi:AsmA-like C-terminal domain-containing protein [Pelagibacterales bacterium SAG-MED32]|nr:AsmA-like C-terminal domain-containing protein [Pelagibacterales bacterium SAG-MED32]
MSKKLLFLYITFSLLVVVTLVIIGLTAKVIFGGLNINFLEQRLSSYLKNEHNITLKSDDFMLMHAQDKGLFIDVSKADLSLSDKTSFSANQIIIDFDINDLFFNNEDQFITVMIDETAIKSVQLSNEIVFKGSILEIKASSLRNIQNSKISMSSALVTGDDIFYEKFYFDFTYDFVDRELVILGFNYGDIFISGPSFIKYNSEKKLWQTKIEIKAKKEPLKKLLNITNNNELDKVVSGFIGWQTISMTSEFESIYKSPLKDFIGRMKLDLSGIYELNKMLPINEFYKNFGNITSYNIEMEKFDDQFKIEILSFKNDKVTFKNGSYVIVDDNLQDSKVNLITSVSKKAVLDYIKTSISTRKGNTNKALNFFKKNLNEENNLVLKFNFNPLSNDIESSILNLKIKSQGSINSNFIFDDNKNPNYTLGSISYDIQLNDFLTENPTIKGELDFTNVKAFIRQINLKKLDNEVLKIKFDSNIQNNIDSEISFKSIDSQIELEGKIKISKTNHLYFESLKLNNSKNVKINISGDLSERILNLSINGEMIDLSMNKISINKKIKEHYLSKENYKIKTNKAIFAGNVKVDDFKAGISKQGELLSVNSKANINNHTLDYSREKNEIVDINIISSSDITYFVDKNHPAKKLLSNGALKMKSVRDLNTMDSKVNIDLQDFVLINSPASLKILSLPSISGLVSIAEGEEGIRFGYGQISYTENEKNFRDINAFAVSDSIGLVMDGIIQREESLIDMSGEISPMHLVNAIIQNVPVLGPIIIGNEGEGLFSIDFSLTGDVDNPEVSSNPLTIIKPRIIERALESISSNQVIQ